jgi:hypothetical protein
MVDDLRSHELRDLTLFFTRFHEPDRYLCVLLATGQPDRDWRAAGLNADEIQGAVRNLRKHWDDAIVSGDMADDADLTGHDQAALSGLLADLVEKGTEVFEAIFNEGYDPDGMPELRTELIAQLGEPRRIGVWSDHLYAPWGLLCLPGSAPATGIWPLGAGPAEKAAGREPYAAETWGPRFLGFRHLIEHRSWREPPVQCGRSAIPTNGRDRPSALSLAIEHAPASHAGVVALLRARTELDDCGWNTTDFLARLHANLFSQQIIYLYCHGQDEELADEPSEFSTGAGAHGTITLAALVKAVGGSRGGVEARAHSCRIRHLPGSPLLYLNVCRAADFTPPSGSSTARKFTGLGTSCTIAPEVIVPMELAAEHAHAFLQLFLTQQSGVGPQLRQVTSLLARTHANTLGLVYGMKGRLETHLRSAA